MRAEDARPGEPLLDVFQRETASRAGKPGAVPPSWVQRVQDVARQVAPENFYGKIELNFAAGGVTVTNVTQSYKT